MTPPTSLTPMQKLHALSYRYYAGQPWAKPRQGDYYTTSRADLELYQVTRVENGSVFTRYCDRAQSTIESEWTEEEFLSDHNFGRYRVYVPEWVFKQ